METLFRLLPKLLVVFLICPTAGLALESTPKQVLIESRLVSMSSNNVKEVGIDWSALNSNVIAEDLSLRSLGRKPPKAEQIGSSLVSSLTSSLFGGGSFGSSDSSSSGSSKQAFISSNPLTQSISPAFSFDDGLEIQLQLQPVVTEFAPEVEFSDSGFTQSASGSGKKVPGTLFGIRVNKKAVKNDGFNIADAFLVAPDGRRHTPSARLVFEVYEEGFYWFSIEFWHWRNGVLVDHWLKTGGDAWSELLGSGSLPLWIGVRFDGITSEMLSQGGWNLVTGWTFEKDDEMFLQPRIFSLLSASTKVIVENGQTVTLGGLVTEKQETTPQTPILGDIPYLGKLFRSANDNTAKEDLMIFVTPRIVKDADE